MAEITLETTKDCAVLRVEGPFTREELVKAIQEYYPQITQRHLIWDFTQCSAFYINGDQLRTLPKLVKEYSNREAGSITVFACPSPSIYGMFRLYSVCAEYEGVPVRYMVTRTFGEALDMVPKGVREDYVKLARHTNIETNQLL